MRIRYEAPPFGRNHAMTYNEAKGEEWAAFDDTARHVATVVALADDALVALDFGPEGVLAADEEEEDHGCCCFQRCTILCQVLTHEKVKPRERENEKRNEIRWYDA